GVDGFGGPAGAALPAGGVMVWEGPGETEGTSFGGRSTGAPVNHCALAAVERVASHRPMAETSPAAPPILVPTIPIGPRCRLQSRQIQAADGWFVTTGTLC